MMESREKESVCAMVYYSAIEKNAFEPVLMRWMKLATYYTEWTKSERKTPIQYTNAYIWNLGRWYDDPICETAKETQMDRTDLWTLWEKARVGWFERIVLKHVYYHMWNRSPVQVWCMRQGAQGWCTGMTLRDGMGRDVGGGFRMGNTCTPMADSCQCTAKPLQYFKVISLQLK